MITRSAPGSYFSSLTSSNFLLLSGLADAVAVDELTDIESIILVSTGKNGNNKIEGHPGDPRLGEKQSISDDVRAVHNVAEHPQDTTRACKTKYTDPDEMMEATTEEGG